MAPGTGDAGRVPPTSLGARGWWQWHGSMQWRRTRYLSNGDFGDIVHCFSFNTIQNDMEYPLKQRESLTGSSLYGLIKFSMHMYIHIYYNYITLNLPKRQAVKDSSRRRSHCIFLGNADRFHGLLSQRAIEVPWLVSVSGKGQRIDNDLLVGSFLVGLRRTS